MTALDLLGLPDFLHKPLAVLLIDLLLASDNALVIALVCVSLAPRRLRAVLLLGTVGAVVLRVLLTALAGGILTLPGLKLAGGALLALLALNLARPDTARSPPPPPAAAEGGVLAAALLVTLIDVLMSFDNVIALAAVAGDSLVYLGLGLALSISILMFGSALVAALLRRHPELARLGVALLGWVAGQMAVSDPVLDRWVAVQAPALPLVVPALAALYLYLFAHPAPMPVAEPLPATQPPPLRPAPVRHPLRRQPQPRRTSPAPTVPPPPVPMAPPAQPSNRVELLIFVGMFVVAGAVLALALVFGSGLVG